jgi:hypothetical protein
VVGDIPPLYPHPPNFSQLPFVHYYCIIVVEHQRKAMIYKVAGLTFLVGASTTEGALFRKHTASALGSGTRRGIDVGKVRGSTDVATVSDANLGFVTHTSSLMSVEGYQAEFATLSAVRGGSVYGQDVALGGDHVTGNMMFTNEMGTINSGSVVYHRGMFNSWYVCCILLSDTPL